ncbi:hypothetical protein P0D91_14840 [Pseudomonas sp. CBSPBW29]|uniref:DUF6966 domain-containing protein n=1 Tax=Pseudomonas TaxID=286 RepID=UPI0021AC763F|nr:MULTISPECIES: hypothetical protein [unclassified Pseudomonas]WEL45320.1 hypothetical protein P0D91_14840 [Pseudomonas sp. CBSPBW29]WEL66428.1 hypothetical protein P0D93_08985 [Pseudomonas sp. CBSPGW29]WEL69908.1 hypothetical protein P0D94_28305 [Pseudomonas sp. CBSPCGW29]WEL76868.1 hypothetical protein P0D92_00920 [Pseudomonas sp. CBSPAW29]WEL84529.1 hypothetical protein P0D95_11445 [Pseudomonas sp. CBSPCAW29]WEL87353.1 hypothetical protein P0D90_27165 [Pseudomonas sp. CBSPCBW29]
MGPKTAELIDVLEELAILLESDGDNHWSRWMRKAKTLLQASDYSGITYLRSAYGGMGSFNDLILGQSSVDGVFFWKPGYKELNDRLEELRSKASQLGTEIQRDQGE